MTSPQECLEFLKSNGSWIMLEKEYGGLGMSASRYYRLIKGDIGVSNECMLQLRRYRTKLYLLKQELKKQAVNAGCFYDFLHSNL